MYVGMFSELDIGLSSPVDTSDMPTTNLTSKEILAGSP